MPWHRGMEERAGFEPAIPFGIHTFQACAIDHSATSPSIQAGSLAELGGGRILLIFHLLPSFKKPFDRLASGQQLHGQDSIDPKHPFLMAFVAIGLHTQIIRALIRLLTNGHGGNHPFRFGIIGLKISKI